MRDWNRVEVIEPGAPQPVKSFPANGVTDALLIPFGQSLITGLLTGIFFGALVAVFRIQVSAWSVGAISGSAGALLAWLSSRNFWRWTIERLLGDTLNLGHEQPAPQPELPAPQPVRVEVIQDEGRRGDFLDLPCRDKIPLLASGVLSGRQFSLSAWTGQNALFSRSEFEAVRDALLTAGLVAWRREGAPAQGVTLTASGRAVFKRLASPTTPLEEE